MIHLNFLNTREVKQIRQEAEDTFGYFPEKKYVYAKNEKDKLFLVNRELTQLNLKNLKIDKVGLYFAEFKNKQFRLSKEGAQLLFLEAQQEKKELKNVVELSEEETYSYFQGEDLKKDLGLDNRLIILRYKNNVLGCAKYKEGKIINFLPKMHRVDVIL